MVALPQLARASLVQGKIQSARRLHIEFSGATPFWAEFEAKDKVSVSKEDLPRSGREPTRI